MQLHRTAVRQTIRRIVIHLTVRKKKKAGTFTSLRFNGRKPLFPDTMLKKIIRPATIRGQIKGKVHRPAFLPTRFRDEPSSIGGRCKKSLRNSYGTQPHVPLWTPTHRRYQPRKDRPVEKSLE